MRPRALRAVTALVAAAIATLGVTAAGPAVAHHVGTYTARDNEVSANFRQLKFSIQARKFDVALRLFEEGALRREMRSRAGTLPLRLEASIRGALRAGDGRAAEHGLMLFFADLVRDLALEADRQVGDAGLAPEARVAAGRKFLEAIWRYYNLIDFVLTQHDSKAAVAVRLAFDEAEGYAKSGAAPVAANPCSGPRRAGARGAPSGPEKLREPLRRIAQTMSAVIEASTSERRPA